MAPAPFIHELVVEIDLWELALFHAKAVECDLQCLARIGGAFIESSNVGLIGFRFHPIHANKSCLIMFAADYDVGHQYLGTNYLDGGKSSLHILCIAPTSPSHFTDL